GGTPVTVSYSPTLFYVLTFVRGLRCNKHIMKKLLLICIIVSSSTLSAQITNLKEFLDVSQATLFTLTDYLEYDWKISIPVETVNDGVVLGKYTYSIKYDEGYDQIIQREIRKHLESGIIMETTRLTSNDKELFDLIIEELEHNRYQLNFITEDKKMFFSKAKSKIIIYTEESEGVTLS